MIERSAALLVPLFSVRTRGDAGIGEIPAIPALAEIAAQAGCSLLQLLPIGEAISGDQSPYSSRSAFAIDPIYIGLEAVEDLREGGLERALGRHLRAALERARKSPRVDYMTTRVVKERALAAGYARFRDRELATGSRRADEFRRFCAEESYWLDDYALFRALEAASGGASWTEWPAPLRDRDAAALGERRAALSETIRYVSYQQWLADTQWRGARGAAASAGVKLAGDLPFMVAADSADLWAHRDDFVLDGSVGAPPDALAPEGQDWDLPPYRWEELARTGDRWIRERARRSAVLYDIYRVDHVVGYFRTYVIPRDPGEKARALEERRGTPEAGLGAGSFTPQDEPAQRAQGERVLKAMRSAGADLIAEDLGTIPPFVRRSLEALSIPGYRVMRWERLWDSPGRPFIEPGTYPACSVATTGTHDTSTLRAWWEAELSPDDRRALCEIAPLHHLRGALAEGRTAFCDEVHEALLDALYSSGSDLAIIPVQDVLGALEQVNVPGTVTDENWTYRLPFSFEDAEREDGLRASLERSARLARKHGRG